MEFYDEADVESNEVLIARRKTDKSRPTNRQ